MSLANAFETGRLWEPLNRLANARRDIYTSFLLLPGLRGFWPMAGISSGGEALDFSGNAQRLEYNGTPTYNLSNSMPYISLNGTTDYLNHVDSVLYDISGTETYIDASLRGLTLGGWFWLNSAGSGTIRPLMTKHAPGASTNRSYALFAMDDDTIDFYAYKTSADYVSSTDTIIHNSWCFVVGRFEPSSAVSLFINSTKWTTATTISDLNNSSSDFRIGADNNPRYLPGRASLCFLCASALPDSLIDNLYQTSRSLFGV